MKNEAKEKVYLLIIIFCVVMCGAMIVTMITGGKADEGETHIPVVREGLNDTNEPIVDVDEEDNGDINNSEDVSGDSTTDKPTNATDSNVNIETHQPADETNKKIAITEEYVNERLGELLPKSFPVNNPIVEIGADGLITLSGRVKRDKLKEYISDLGVDLGLKYSVALLMMPKELDAEVALTLNEGNDGKMYAKLKSASLSETEIPVSLFPQKVADVISNAVNRLITSVDGTFEFYGFEDGAILFASK